MKEALSDLVTLGDLQALGCQKTRQAAPDSFGRGCMAKAGVALRQMPLASTTSWWLRKHATHSPIGFGLGCAPI